MDFSFNKLSKKNKNQAGKQESLDELNEKNRRGNSKSNGGSGGGLSLKIAFLGAAMAGKTAFAAKYAMDRYNDSYTQTVGASFFNKSLFVGGRDVRLQIWDVSGSERYASLASMYFRGAAGIVIGYDITEPSSLSKARTWYNAVRTSGIANNTVFMVVGYKADLEESRRVPYSDGEAFAREVSTVPYFEGKY